MQSPAIMFHHFRDDLRHPAGQGAISAIEFRDLLLHVGIERILPAREYLRRHLNGTLRPHDQCLTFDDNVRCQWDVAVPILNELGLTAFWFVYTSVMHGQIERLEVYRYFRTTRFTTVDDFYTAFDVALEHRGISPSAALARFDARSYLKPFPFYTTADRRFRFLRDEVLGPEQYGVVMEQMLADANVSARELASDLWMTADHLRWLHESGHVVGLHSHSHPTRLERMSEADQHREYTANFTAIQRITGEVPTTVSHPCNSYSSATLGVLRKLGVRLGFRSNTDFPQHSELELPRQDHSNIVRQMCKAA